MMLAARFMIVRFVLGATDVAYQDKDIEKVAIFCMLAFAASAEPGDGAPPSHADERPFGFFVSLSLLLALGFD